MSINKIIAYENQGKIILGWIQELAAKKYQVLNQFNQIVSLSEDRVYIFESKIFPKNIKELEEELKKIKTEIDLELLWENVEDEYLKTLGELCSINFSTFEFIDELSLRTKLIEKNPYFKREDNGFSKRSITAVEAYKKQLEVESQNDLVDLELYKYLKNPTELTSSIKPLYQRLLQFISKADISVGDLKRIKNVLTKIRSEENNNYDLEIFGYNYLLKQKLIDQKFNPIIHRYKFNPIYALDDIKIKKDKILSDQCITIDDSSTMDMDDAFSLEKTIDGFKLGIYISNVAEYITPDSKVGLQAKRLASSIYSAEKTYHMLAPEYSEDLLSLKAGQERSVIGIILDVDKDFEISNPRIELGNIIVKEKLNYEEVDLKLENDDELLNNLYRIAVTHEAIRLDKGSFQSNRIAPKIYFENDVLKSGIYDESSPARVLVSELMIITNKLFGEYAQKNKLPVVYRMQTAPEGVKIDISDYPEGVVREFYSKTGLKPSRNTFTPSSHWGLGLDVYLQATSPIRRYLDLHNQTCILNSLKSQSTDIELELDEVENKVSLVNTVQKESERYWLLSYLKSINLKETSGTVLKIDRIGCLVFIEQFHISLFAKFNKKPKIGETVKIKVNKINPFDLDIKMEIV